MYLKGLPYIAHYLKDKIVHKSASYTILLYIALTATYAVIQYLFYPNLRNLEYLGWDPHQFRMFGSVFDTSTAAAIYGLILIFLVFEGRKLLRVRALWIASIVAFGVFGALTYSRGFYISIIVTLLYLLIIKHKRLISAAYLVLMAAAVIILLPKPAGESANLTRTFTVQARAADYEKGLEVWKKNLVFGVGYNHLRYAKPGAGDTAGNHAGASLTSSFLIVLATMGIVGLAAFCLMLLKLSALNTLSFYTIVFLSLFSLSDNILLHPFILFMEVFLIAWSLTSRISR
jgi:hypothetical protein